MEKLTNLIAAAKTSRLKLLLLNFSLSKTIPFNSPHGIKLQAITEQVVKALLPYKKVNLNHLAGLHACALAAASEFSAGILLLSKFNSAEYRLIMKELKMTYHSQAKEAVITLAKIPEQDVMQKFSSELKANSAAFLPMLVECHTLSDKHICTASVLWQIKEWGQVKSGGNAR